MTVQKLTVVSGPPCAGKTHHIEQHRDPTRSIVIDLDQLAVAAGYPATHLDPTDTEHPARQAAYIARASLLTRTLTGKLTAPEVWIIDSRPTRASRANYERIGASIITIDPGPDLCHQRADDDHRSPHTHAIIDAWYSITDRPGSSRTW